MFFLHPGKDMKIKLCFDTHSLIMSLYWKVNWCRIFWKNFEECQRSASRMWARLAEIIRVSLKFSVFYPILTVNYFSRPISRVSILQTLIIYLLKNFDQYFWRLQHYFLRFTVWVKWSVVTKYYFFINFEFEWIIS